MKTSSLILSVAVAAGLTSCISIERTTPSTTVTREVVTTSPGTPTVITTLPRGYRTRVVKGTTYYYYDNVYYRTAPGGYVIVERP